MRICANWLGSVVASHGARPGPALVGLASSVDIGLLGPYGFGNELLRSRPWVTTWGDEPGPE